jgi:uncharacterized cupin superfamily protein
VLAHWDEAEGGRAEVGHLAARWTDLGIAAGTRTVGLSRIEIDPGKWATPLHRHTAEEEIFYVLRGSGVSLQRRPRAQTTEACEVRAGDCLVHPAGGPSHTLRAAPEGLDVLAFGMRVRTEIGHLPRGGVAWLGRTWVDVGAGDHPWEREVAAGKPEVPGLSERPASIVNVEDVEGEYEGRWRRLAMPAGAVLSGLSWGRLEEGEEGAAPHIHSVEEEIYVVLEGEGELELWPSPQLARGGSELERRPVRAGHVASFPAGGGIGHGIRAGAAGLTYLAYGTKSAADVCYYPRSNKIFFRGLGLVARLEDLDYFDGEPAE